MLAQPIGDRLLVELTRGDSAHQVHGVVSGDFETMAVEGEEDGQRLPREQQAYARVEVANILNRANKISGTTSSSMYYEAGRSFWLELGYRF